MEVNEEIKSDRMKKSVVKIVMGVFSPAISSNIHRNFNNTFQESKSPEEDNYNRNV